MRRGGLSVNITDLLTEEQWAQVETRFEDDALTTGAREQGFDGLVLRQIGKITGWPTIVHKGARRGASLPWAGICLEAVREASDGDANRAIVMLNLIQQSERWAFRPMVTDRFPSFLQAALADVGAGVGIAANRLAPRSTGAAYRPSKAVLKLLTETKEAASAKDRNGATADPAQDVG